MRIGKPYLIRCPLPKSSRNHLSHITTEAVDTFLSPEKQDVRHLTPSIGNRIEMAHATSIIVDAVIQLCCLIPIVNARCIVETIIARSLGWILNIRFILTVIEIKVRRKTLTWTIIKIILWVKTQLWTILLTQILHTLRLTDTMILTSHMIRHKINDDLHASLMCTLNRLFKLLHTPINVCCQIRIYSIIVSYGVWRPGHSLDDSRMILGDTICSIVRLGSMTDNACVPNMAHAHVPDLFQGSGREVIHLSATVLLYRSTLFTSGVPITIETGENLIDNNLIRYHGQKPHC